MQYKLKRLPHKETPEITEYTKAIEKGRYSQFVIYSPIQNGWFVKNHVKSKKITYYTSLSQARTAAKNLAAKHEAEVFVFDQNAKIIERFRTHKA